MKLLCEELLVGESSRGLSGDDGSRCVGRHCEVGGRLLERRLTGEGSEIVCFLIRPQDLFTGSGKVIFRLHHVIRGRISFPSNLIQYISIALLSMSDDGFYFV